MKADLVDTEWRIAQALQTLQDADDDGYLDPGTCYAWPQRASHSQRMQTHVAPPCASPWQEGVHACGSCVSGGLTPLVRLCCAVERRTMSTELHQLQEKRRSLRQLQRVSAAKLFRVKHEAQDFEHAYAKSREAEAAKPRTIPCPVCRLLLDLGTSRTRLVWG